MTRWARFARGWAAALVSIFVAAFAHQLAGGPLPGTASVLLCLAFSGMVCIALAGKRLSRPRLAVSVAASQLMFHGLFSLLSAPTRFGTPTFGTPTSGHLHGRDLTAQLAMVQPVPHLHGETGMWVAHLAAAVLTFLVLSYSERAFWRLFELGFAVTRLARMPDSPVRGARVSLVALWVESVLPRVRRPLLSPMRHRGPPVASFA